MEQQLMGQVIDGHTVKFVRHVPQPVERVWRAISDERELQAWMRIRCHSKPSSARKVQLFGEGEIEGEVFIADPPRTLAFSFWSAGSTKRR